MMKKILFIAGMYISLATYSQCDFYIDTVIKPSLTNINGLNSVEKEHAGVCIDSIYPSEGLIHYEIVATSNEMIFEWYDLPKPGCVYGEFYTRVYDSSCAVVPFDTIPYLMPFTGWNGHKGKHYRTNIGEKYTIEITYEKNGRGCDGFQICVWAYSIGPNFLDLFTSSFKENELIEQAFPNQSNEVVYFNVPKVPLTVEILTLSGEVYGVLEKEQGKQLLEVGTLNFSPGIYFFCFIDQALNRTIKKVVVRH